MKIRHGFVSNSSSSSFIIEVDSKLSYDEVLEQIVNILASECNDYFDNVTIPKDGCYYTYDEKYEYLINKFKSNEDIFKEFELEKLEGNKYHIIFWTAMKNEMNSFGDICASLLMLLTSDSVEYIKFIKSIVKDD